METPKASGSRWRGASIDDLQLPAAFALPASECVLPAGELGLWLNPGVLPEALVVP